MKNDPNTVNHKGLPFLATNKEDNPSNHIVIEDMIMTIKPEIPAARSQITESVPEPKYMLSADGTKCGIIKKFNSRRCRLEGCTGVRIHVVWPDGKSTYPCSKGCHPIDKGTLQIG